jgi:hypothetical protein
MGSTRSHAAGTSSGTCGVSIAHPRVGGGAATVEWATVGEFEVEWSVTISFNLFEWIQALLQVP